MKIIIAGDGDTGSHLARQLSREDQDVVLMGTDTDRLADMDSRHNIMTFEGEATSLSALREAGAAGCDLFVAVTPWGNSNIVSAQLAKSMGAVKTMARIDNPELIDAGSRHLMQRLGIDTLVYPEYLASKAIAATLDHAWLRNRYSIHDGAIVVAGAKIRPGAPIDGMAMREFGKSVHGFHVAAIRRGNDTIIPRGDDTILGRDMVWFTLAGGEEAELARLCGRANPHIRKVMVAGAGKMTRVLCANLTTPRDLTVIDPDRKRCRRLLEATGSNVTVVNADYRDLDVLREEKLRDMDAFLALTDSSETNIVSCLVARDFGVAKTVAEIEDMQYFSEADSLDIDTLINKKLLTSSCIYQMMLDSILPTPRCLAIEDAEVAEIVVREGAGITSAAVRDLKFPKGTTLGGLIRDGRGMLVGGDTRIMAGDHLVVFCLSGALPRMQKLLR